MIAKILRRVGDVGESPMIELDTEVAVIRVRKRSVQSSQAIGTIDFLLGEELENIGVVDADGCVGLKPGVGSGRSRSSSGMCQTAGKSQR